jgi:Flp pilus assembly protein TadD
MRCLFSVLFLGLAVIYGMMAGGCASREAPRPIWRMGDHHRLLDKQQASMAALGEAHKTLPEMTAEEYTMAGDTYLLQHNLPMAFVQYDKALRLAPRQLSLRYKKGLILLQRHLAREALREFQDILHTDETFALAYEGCGQALLLLGDIPQAEHMLQRAIALDASLWKAHQLAGMIYDHQRRFDAAIASYTAALALKKDEGSLYNNLGVSYHRKGDYDNAVRAFEKALHMGDADARVSNNLGLSLAKLGRYQDALVAFTRGGDQAKAQNNLGVIYLTAGKYREAVAAFEKALQLSPRYYATASENLRIAQQALAASPRDPAVLSPPSGDSRAQAAR